MVKCDRYMGRPNPCDQEAEGTDGRWKVAHAFQPVNQLKHRLESLCHTSDRREIARIGVGRHGEHPSGPNAPAKRMAKKNRKKLLTENRTSVKKTNDDANSRH